MGDFAKFLSETKHHNTRSMVCGHCAQPLSYTKIVRNPGHVYDIGTHFSCPCGKSAVWTNSIRGDDQFLANLGNCEYDYHRRGFCNDAFCGHCYGYFVPLKNGVEFAGKYVDRYGCEKCKQNQHVMVDLYDKDKEGEETTRKLTKFYHQHAPAIKSLG